MPRIFDNLSEDSSLLLALRDTLGQSFRADFCVGYFNLRGWRLLAPAVDRWPGGDEAQARLLVGMQRPPQESVHRAFAVEKSALDTDLQTVARHKRPIVQEFKDQLVIGAPTNADEAALRALSAQLHTGRLAVRLFLKHPLHAKLYLLHRPDPITPLVAYLGSSNLTLSGLSKQGELNVDVVDYDATQKLQAWFDARWGEEWCLDISAELADIIDTSWAREVPLDPYLVYLKIAYHLAREAREGLNEFKIPGDVRERLFPFQRAAVQIAAQHLSRRGGVLLGDVVGLGKTLMATALVRVFQARDDDANTLIICPKNLTRMWEDHRDEFGLAARVVSLTDVENTLPNLKRFRFVVIDESHNLRNPEGKRYRVIQDYIRRNDARCILLSATPYNKSYGDLSAQLKLFVEPDQDLGVRPEALIRSLGESAFLALSQSGPRTIAAFEKSEEPEDWRYLMRRYLVRRTRTFIQEHYAETDECNRTYLTLPDGRQSYFPIRTPKTAKFTVDEANPLDQYARLFAPAAVDAVDALALPRYGLGIYADPRPAKPPSAKDREQLANLSRAGQRLRGFSRTNLFKRLESSGAAFLFSVERHLLRNAVYLYAVENGLDLPIGTQDPNVLDTRFTDDDRLFADADPAEPGIDDIAADAARVYARYAGPSASPAGAGSPSS